MQKIMKAYVTHGKRLAVAQKSHVPDKTLFRRRESRGEGRALFRKRSLSSRFRRLISLSKRARGAFCAAALNPECRRSSTYYGLRASSLSPSSTFALFDGVTALRCYIKRYSMSLCLYILGTCKRARARKEGAPPRNHLVSLSLQFALHFSYSRGFTIRSFVLLSLLFLSYAHALLSLFAHISSFFFAFLSLRERCLIQAAVCLAVP